MASSTQSDLNHNPRHQEVHDLEYITIVDLMGHHAPRHTPEHETDWHQLAIRLEMALADPEIPRRYRIEYLILAAMVTSHFGNDRTPLLRLANENLEYLVRVWQRQGAPQWIIEERTAMLVDMLMAIDDPEQIERFKAREVARQEKEAAREEKEVCDKKRDGGEKDQGGSSSYNEQVSIDSGREDQGGPSTSSQQDPEVMKRSGRKRQ